MAPSHRHPVLLLLALSVTGVCMVSAKPWTEVQGTSRGDEKEIDRKPAALTLPLRSRSLFAALKPGSPPVTSLLRHLEPDAPPVQQGGPADPLSESTPRQPDHGRGPAFGVSPWRRPAPPSRAKRSPEAPVQRPGPLVDEVMFYVRRLYGVKSFLMDLKLERRRQRPGTGGGEVVPVTERTGGGLGPHIGESQLTHSGERKHPHHHSAEVVASAGRVDGKRPRHPPHHPARPATITTPTTTTPTTPTTTTTTTTTAARAEGKTPGLPDGRRRPSSPGGISVDPGLMGQRADREYRLQAKIAQTADSVRMMSMAERARLRDSMARVWHYLLRTRDRFLASPDDSAQEDISDELFVPLDVKDRPQASEGSSSQEEDESREAEGEELFEKDESDADQEDAEIGELEKEILEKDDENLVARATIHDRGKGVRAGWGGGLHPHDDGSVGTDGREDQEVHRGDQGRSPSPSLAQPAVGNTDNTGITGHIHNIDNIGNTDNAGKETPGNAQPAGNDEKNTDKQRPGENAPTKLALPAVRANVDDDDEEEAVNDVDVSKPSGLPLPHARSRSRRSLTLHHHADTDSGGAGTGTANSGDDGDDGDGDHATDDTDGMKQTLSHMSVVQQQKLLAYLNGMLEAARNRGRRLTSATTPRIDIADICCVVG